MCTLRLFLSPRRASLALVEKSESQRGARAPLYAGVRSIYAGDLRLYFGVEKGIPRSQSHKLRPSFSELMARHYPSPRQDKTALFQTEYSEIHNVRQYLNNSRRLNWKILMESKTYIQTLQHLLRHEHTLISPAHEPSMARPACAPAISSSSVGT